MRYIQKCPDIDTKDRQIWYDAGQRSVVKMLISVYDEQYDITELAMCGGGGRPPDRSEETLRLQREQMAEQKRQYEQTRADQQARQAEQKDCICSIAPPHLLQLNVQRHLKYLEEIQD